ncbi:MAG: hypothetical protein J6T10_22400 [Methanobrevibacter sp.]|nr:hypothetical protein [Methanobrevibacter sp.]
MSDVAKNTIVVSLFAVNVKSSVNGFVIHVPNVIVYAVAHVATFNIYCIQPCTLQALIVKLADGTIFIVKYEIVTTLQLV